MRIHRLFCLGAVLVFAQVALAKLPFSNEALGKVEGTLDICAQDDAQATSKYQERKNALVRGLPEKELAEARQAQAYKDAYESVSAELSTFPKDHVVEACTAFLKGDK
jgi:ABC-type taurine transport system substrate-binding protein